MGGGAVAAGPAPADALGDDARALLAAMWRIRAVEDRLSALGLGGDRPPSWRGVGHEAVAAGVCGVLDPAEPAFVGVSALGHALAKGVPAGPLVAELLGRADGCCRGLGGGTTLVDAARGLFADATPPGGTVALAVGAALADRCLGRARAVVALVAAEAVAAGAFHESVNLASLWRLPVVVVCEHDAYDATGAPARTRAGRVADLVAPHEVATAVVDGGDVGEVRRAFLPALEAARRGEGPFLLECLTHRARLEGAAHGAPDGPDAGRWTARDPIARLVRRATAAGWFDATASRGAEADARREAAAAVAFAQASPRPDPALAAGLTFAPGDR